MTDVSDTAARETADSLDDKALAAAAALAEVTLDVAGGDPADAIPLDEPGEAPEVPAAALARTSTRRPRAPRKAGTGAVAEAVAEVPAPEPAIAVAVESGTPVETAASGAVGAVNVDAAAHAAPQFDADQPALATVDAPAEQVVPVETDVAEPVIADETAAATAIDAGESEPAEAGEAPAEPEPPRATFADTGLSEPILRAVADTGYLHPTPIQEQAIPVVLMGRDVLGVAQTGTGKTASFTLPMLEILAGSRAKARMPRSLILEPTRELALQVAENFVKYGKHLNLVHALLIGGESMTDQRAVLDKGVDVLIATPGRLLDLFERGRILLADCKILVIDEADRMLDMGFIPDVERIVSLLSPMRQTLFFSATMAPEIRKLADAFLQNPREITVARPASVATTITAGLVYVQEHDKREALRRLVRHETVQNALIFCNRKRDVDILYKSLSRHGFSVGALHGDLPQPVRFTTLEKFKAGELQLLVCSDVAARGIDIGGLSHVFNFDVPFHAEDYVHRIGRTGRAGRQGHAYTIASPDEVKAVGAIEKLIGAPIPPLAVEGLDPVSPEELAEAATRSGRGRGRGGKPEARGGKPGERRGERFEDRRGSGNRGRDRGPRDAERPARGPQETAEAEIERAPREARRDESRPRRRDEAGRDEPRRDEPRREEPRREEPRRDDRRRDEPQARSRREEGRRRDRDDRDLGAPVKGFGDAVPAFMLIPIPRSRREAEPEAEAA